MLKKIHIILFLFIFLNNIKSQIYNSTTGFVSFFSTTPLKNIYADTKLAMCILKINTNEIAVRINNASFKFDNSLMEEHFNEKYIETSKYPTSTFLGKINEKINFEKIGEYDITITGKFKIHGIEQNKLLVGKLIITKDQINLNGEFKIKLDDYKIEKPKIVFKEIADELDLKVNINLTKK